MHFKAIALFKYCFLDRTFAQVPVLLWFPVTYLYVMYSTYYTYNFKTRALYEHKACDGAYGLYSDTSPALVENDV